MTEPRPFVFICGKCRAVRRGTQLPAFCGSCRTIGAPFLALRTKVEDGAGARVRLQLETEFVGPWEEAARATWEARLAGVES